MTDPAKRYGGEWTAPFDKFWTERRAWAKRKGRELGLSPVNALIDMASPGGPYIEALDEMDKPVLSLCRQIINALEFKANDVRADVERGVYKMSPSVFRQLVEERVKRYGVNADKLNIVWTNDDLATRQYGDNTIVFLKADPGQDFVRALLSADHELFGHGETRFVSGMRPALQRRGESGDETDAHLFDYFASRSFPQAVRLHSLLRDMRIEVHEDLTPVKIYLRMMIPDAFDTRQESDLLRLPLYNAHRRLVFQDTIMDKTERPPHQAFLESWYARYNEVFGTEAPKGSHFEDIQMFCAPERQIGAYAAGLYAAAGFYDTLLLEKLYGQTPSENTGKWVPLHDEALYHDVKVRARNAIGLDTTETLRVILANVSDQGKTYSFLDWYGQEVGADLSTRSYVDLLNELYMPLLYPLSILTPRPADPPPSPQAGNNPARAGRLFPFP